MSEVMTRPDPVLPVERKCKIDEVFDPGFIELFRLAPRNPHVRALILKLAGKMPGPECETFEQLKEWTETTCEKRKRPLLNQSISGGLRGGISIHVDFSETEYGSANYSAPRSGSAEFELGAEELLEVIQEVIDAQDGMDEIVDIIFRKIVDDAWDRCDPSLDDYGDYEYENHEANDSGTGETTCSKDQIRHRVLDFLRERHPQLAAQF